MVDSALVIMAKAPMPGQVKTRLCPPLTPDLAAELYRCMLYDKLAQAKSISGIDVFLALPEDQPISGPDIIRQRGSELGERLECCLKAALKKGYRHVLLVDSDSPTLPARFFVAGISAIRNGADIVLGPTIDGGYYLIGLSAPCHEVFTGIPWSTNKVFERTLEKAAGMSLELLPEWYDVDTPEDLGRLMNDPAVPSAAPRTAAWLAEWATREAYKPAGK